MVDCCANTSLMRARPDSLLHCMAKTSLMRAFFSAQVLALCPFVKCMGTLYHNRAPTQEKFCAAQRRAVRSEAFPVLHGVEHSRFSASPVHQSQREGPWHRQSPRHAAERASHVRASMKGARRGGGSSSLAPCSPWWATARYASFSSMSARAPTMWDRRFSRSCKSILT